MNYRELDGLLEKLGLTEYESKTLSTLFRAGETEAPSLSRLAQVPKTRVYDVLDKLVEKNLVIELKGRPKRYRAIDAKKGFESLIGKKKDELKLLEESISGIESMLSSPEKQEFGETVMKVKNRQDFERILGQEISRAKNSVIGFSELSDKHPALREAIEIAKQNKVSIKLLNSFQNNWLSKATETKQCEHGLNAFILDGKQVVMALSDFKQEKPEYHFTIFHNNKPVANALMHYFEKCWGTAKRQ